MRVPPRFCIVIEGTRFRAREREHIQKGLAHYLTELLVGSDVSEGEFRSWGLRVSVDIDRDQGPEEVTMFDR